MIDAPFLFAQRLQLPAAIVNDADGGSEPEFHGALPNHQRVLRMRNATAHHRIDIHVKISVLCEQLQLLVEYLQALLRHLIGIHVVDGNLQPLESRAIQPLYALRHQQISVRDQSRDHAIGANAADHVIELRMHQRLATRNRHDGRSQCAQLVDAPVHLLDRHRLRKIVKLVAVGTSQVAAPHRNDVRQQRMVGRSQCPRHHLRPPQIAVQGLGVAAQSCE